MASNTQIYGRRIIKVRLRFEIDLLKSCEGSGMGSKRGGYEMLDTDRSQDQTSRERDRTYQINIKKVKIINHSNISESRDVAGYRVTLLSLYWCW